MLVAQRASSRAAHLHLPIAIFHLPLALATAPPPIAVAVACCSSLLLSCCCLSQRLNPGDCKLTLEPQTKTRPPQANSSGIWVFLTAIRRFVKKICMLPAVPELEYRCMPMIMGHGHGCCVAACLPTLFIWLTRSSIVFA